MLKKPCHTVKDHVARLNAKVYRVKQFSEKSSTVIFQSKDLSWILRSQHQKSISRQILLVTINVHSISCYSCNFCSRNLNFFLSTLVCDFRHNQLWKIWFQKHKIFVGLRNLPKNCLFGNCLSGWNDDFYPVSNYNAIFVTQLICYLLSNFPNIQACRVRFWTSKTRFWTDSVQN